MTFVTITPKGRVTSIRGDKNMAQETLDIILDAIDGAYDTAIDKLNEIDALRATVAEQRRWIAERDALLAKHGISLDIPFDTPETEKTDAGGNVWKRGELLP